MSNDEDSRGRQDVVPLALTRRGILKLMGAGIAIVAIPDLTACTIETAPGPHDDRLLASAKWLVVSRRDDLVVLTVGIIGLDVIDAGKTPPPSGLALKGSLYLGRTSGPAYILVDHPPQHILEETFQEPDLGPPAPGTLPAGGPVQHRIARKSRLSFFVPDAIVAIPYELDAILAAISTLQLHVAPNAWDEPPGSTLIYIPSFENVPVVRDPSPAPALVPASTLIKQALKGARARKNRLAFGVVNPEASLRTAVEPDRASPTTSSASAPSCRKRRVAPAGCRDAAVGDDDGPRRRSDDASDRRVLARARAGERRRNGMDGGGVRNGVRREHAGRLERRALDRRRRPPTGVEPGERAACRRRGARVLRRRSRRRAVAPRWNDGGRRWVSRGLPRHCARSRVRSCVEASWLGLRRRGGVGARRGDRRMGRDALFEEGKRAGELGARFFDAALVEQNSAECDPHSRGRHVVASGRDSNPDRATHEGFRLATSPSPSATRTSRRRRSFACSTMTSSRGYVDQLSRGARAHSRRRTSHSRRRFSGPRCPMPIPGSRGARSLTREQPFRQAEHGFDIERSTCESQTPSAHRLRRLERRPFDFLDIRASATAITNAIRCDARALRSVRARASAAPSKRRRSMPFVHQNRHEGLHRVFSSPAGPRLRSREHLVYTHEGRVPGGRLVRAHDQPIPPKRALSRRRVSPRVGRSLRVRARVLRHLDRVVRRREGAGLCGVRGAAHANGRRSHSGSRGNCSGECRSTRPRDRVRFRLAPRE